MCLFHKTLGVMENGVDPSGGLHILSENMVYGI